MTWREYRSALAIERRGQRRFLVIATVAAGCIWPVTNHLTGFGAHWGFYAFMPALVVSAYLVKSFMAWAMDRDAYKAWSAQVPVLSGAITGEGITVDRPEDEGGPRSLEWERFAACRLSPGVVLLAYSRGGSEIFPRSYFATDDDWEGFRRLAAEKLGGGAPAQDGGSSLDPGVGAV